MHVNKLHVHIFIFLLDSFHCNLGDNSLLTAVCISLSHTHSRLKSGCYALSCSKNFRELSLVIGLEKQFIWVNKCSKLILLSFWSLRLSLILFYLHDGCRSFFPLLKVIVFVVSLIHTYIYLGVEAFVQKVFCQKNCSMLLGSKTNLDDI